MRVGQQGDGHSISILAQLAADKLGAAQHIAPLVIAAELHVAAVMLEHVVEVVALHDHVVELEEGQALLHALLIALGAQHVVDGEAGAHVAQQLDVVQIQQPVAVVDDNCLALGKIDEPAHLFLEAVYVVLDGLLRHHLAHVGLAGRVADHCRTAANEDDGLVARHLEALHQAERHKVSHVQAVCGGVEADVEGCLAGIHQFFDFLFVGHLCDEPTPFEFFKHCHFLQSPLFFWRSVREKKSPDSCIFAASA